MAANRSERRPELVRHHGVSHPTPSPLCPTNRVGGGAAGRSSGRGDPTWNPTWTRVPSPLGRSLARAYKPNTLSLLLLLFRFCAAAWAADQQNARANGDRPRCPRHFSGPRAPSLGHSWATRLRFHRSHSQCTHRVEPSSPINALYVARVLRTPGSHFEASTPLTSSHSARDSSAMKIGIRNAMFARSGATSSRKLLTT